MNIISEFAIEADFKERFEDTTTPIAAELRKFAHEVCHEYDLRVINMTSSSTQQRRANLVTENGIPCGYVALTREGDGKHTYFLGLPTVNKERSSSKSHRGERDSNKISSLLRAIKKNKEEPTAEKIYNVMRRDFISPFSTVQSKSMYGRPAISMPSHIQEVAVKHILGVDTLSMAMYIDDLKKVYSEHQLKMKSYDNSASEIVRYRRGATLIGVFRHSNTNTYYLTADVSLNEEGDFTFHTPLKRYSTLKELPIAPVVAMVNTYMQGKDQYDNTNELGLWFQDRFFEDLDIAVGYSGSASGLWVAIPKEAP
jgi:hypothetical protein